MANGSFSLIDYGSPITAQLYLGLTLEAAAKAADAKSEEESETYGREYQIFSGVFSECRKTQAPNAEYHLQKMLELADLANSAATPALQKNYAGLFKWHEAQLNSMDLSEISC